MLYVTALIVAVRLPVLSLLLVLCYLYKTIRILTVISISCGYMAAESPHLRLHWPLWHMELNGLRKHLLSYLFTVSNLGPLFRWPCLFWFPSFTFTFSQKGRVFSCSLELWKPMTLT